ncbi:zeta-sarcoglycan-like [Salarias fasciatus]|uniref:zeta-sarcoglycan-like n=1 Tax=Salarias fasciatus TaxID=181472 RepID=UPI001176D5A3|nr:zeta-sarcoglycan-like [Salarias fasciatus]
MIHWLLKNPGKPTLFSILFVLHACVFRPVSLFWPDDSVFVFRRLESPTRTLTLEAPRGVEINAGVGDFSASCRKDLLLQSSDGEIILDANTIKLGNVPLGSAVDPLEGAPAGTTYTKQTVYELCACANGKLYLSPAEKGSTCQTTSNFCLWS